MNEKICFSIGGIPARDGHTLNDASDVTGGRTHWDWLGRQWTPPLPPPLRESTWGGWGREGGAIWFSATTLQEKGGEGSPVIEQGELHQLPPVPLAVHTVTESGVGSRRELFSFWRKLLPNFVYLYHLCCSPNKYFFIGHVYMGEQVVSCFLPPGRGEDTIVVMCCFTKQRGPN